jgi:hypothetical protein
MKEMENQLRNLSSAQLRRAAEIIEKIEALEQELAALGRGETGLVKRGTRSATSNIESKRSDVKPRKQKVMSAATRAKIAAGQKARWAKFHAAKGK